MELQLNLIIFAIANFLLLVALLYKFLYGPLTKAMDNRRQSIKEALDAADLAKKEADSTRSGLHDEILSARQEADNLLEAAKKSSDLLRDEMRGKSRRRSKEYHSKSQG